MLTKESACCFTGYRPEKLPALGDERDKHIIDLKVQLYEAVLLAADEGYRYFLCGMARGFDIFAAETVLALKSHVPFMQLIAAVPYYGQERAWSTDWQVRYHHILDQTDRIVYISQVYYKGCQMARNKYLVDHSSKIIAYFDGRPGGTAFTYRYACKKQLSVVNLACEEVRPTCPVQ